jgi:hypothetical protein
MPIAEPHKELRFTRAAQGTSFALIALALILVGLTIIGLQFAHSETPIPHWAWGGMALLGALVAGRCCLHCTRHAYLILTPLGVEIFPFFKPQSGMQLITWSEIAAVDETTDRLTLHFNAEKTAGIHLSLAPIRREQRPLLLQAVRARIISSTTS